jgi:hypothetical protein
MSRLSDLESSIIWCPDDFDVCWAGPNLVDPSGGLCFGSIDGKLLFLDIEGQPIVVPGKGVRAPGSGSVSGEAINGVARVGTWVGVSTREEMNFWPLEGLPGGHDKGVVAPYGAHNITSSSQGYFVAPLGKNGIMVMQPPSDRSARVKAFSSDEAGLYAYRIAVLPQSPAGTEVIACACRRGGVVVGEFAAGRQTLNLKRAALPGFDAVDVCALDHGTESRAIAALGRDGTLALFRGGLDNNKPVTLRFQSVQGVAYRILSSHGDIYVLTSKGLFVLGELAGRFLRNELTSEVNTPVRMSLLEAVDANLVDNRWLVVVMLDMVAKFDLEMIHQQVLDHLDDAEIQESHTMDGAVEWEWQGVDTNQKQLALTG